MSMNDPLDLRVRLAAFQWLQSQKDVLGDTLPRAILEEGFTLDDRRIRLVGPQGIFKPAGLRIPLSITSIPGGPYSDRESPSGLLYAYRGTDPSHPDNAGLREAMRTQTPLVYFYRVTPGRYLAEFPVFVVGDTPDALMFTVQFDDPSRVVSDLSLHLEAPRVADVDLRREYVTAAVRRRLHQQAFRERVLRAYQDQCTLCRLRHRELLDAAHIIADALDEGDPVIPNGLALCKLHHAAYDRMFLSVRPDYIIEVRPAILDEADGPMLQHGLKGLHGQPIVLPPSAADHPDPERLRARHEAFMTAT
jgi:putative restriction endonuclease